MSDRDDDRTVPASVPNATGDDLRGAAGSPATSYCPGEVPDERRQLMASLGHELRNPLGALRTALELLAEEPEEVETRRRLHRVVRRQIDHLDRLVEDLIESSRSPRPGLAMRWESLDLAALVAEVVEAQRPELAAAERRLEVGLEGPVWVEGDAVRLSQVVRNLLSNARRFTEPQGRIEVRLDVTEQGEARLRVADDGCGLAAGEAEVIFEPFRRSGDTAAQERGESGRRSSNGLGLGLTIVRRLVEAHGGSVRATSDGPDRGTELVVLLPVLRASSPAD